MVKNTNIRVSESKDTENKPDKTTLELLTTTKETKDIITKNLPKQNDLLQDILKALKNSSKANDKKNVSNLDEEIKRLKLEEIKSRIQKIKQSQTPKNDKKPTPNDESEKKYDPKLDGPYNDKQGGPYSSTLLSIMTGGIINPAVANMLGMDKMLKKVGNALISAPAKAINTIQNRYSDSNNTDENTNDSNEQSNSNNRIDRDVGHTNNKTQKIIKHKIGGISDIKDEDSKDTSDKKRKTSAVDRAEDAPVINRLDSIIGILNKKKESNVKTEPKEEKESLISKIFGIMKNVASAGISFLGTLLSGVKQLVVFGLVIKGIQAAVGLLNLFKSTFNGLINSIKTVTSGIKALLAKLGLGSKVAFSATPATGIKNATKNVDKKGIKAANDNVNKPNTSSSAKDAAGTSKNAAKAQAKATKTASKASKAGKLTKAAGKLGKVAKVGGKLAAPIAVVQGAMDAGATTRDLMNYGLEGTRQLYEQEAKDASTVDNLLNLLNPMKYAYSIQELTYRGMEKLFGTKDQRAYEKHRNETYDAIMKKIDEMYNDPRYRNEDNLFDLNKVDAKDRGAAFDYLVQLIEQTGSNPYDPLNSGTLTGDYIADRQNYDRFYNRRMYERATNANIKNLAQSYMIESEPKMSEETYMATIRNEQDQARMNQLTNTINNNNSNTTTNNAPVTVNNNVSMLKEYNAYNSGPAANTLGY